MPALLVVVLDVSPIYSGLRTLLNTKPPSSSSSTSSSSSSPATPQQQQQSQSSSSKGPGTLTRDIIQAITSFLIVMNMMDSRNQWILIATTPTRNAKVAQSNNLDQEMNNGNKQESGISPTANILAGIEELIRLSLEDVKQSSLNNQKDPKRFRNGGVTGGITSGLCVINKIMKSSGGGSKRKRAGGRVVKVDDVLDDVPSSTSSSNSSSAPGASITNQSTNTPHILVIQTTPDSNKDYNSIMNSAFAASRSRIQIDALYLNITLPSSLSSPFTQEELEADSNMLHQITDLTGGLYMPPPKGVAQIKGALTMILTNVYLGGGIEGGCGVNEEFIGSNADKTKKSSKEKEKENAGIPKNQNVRSVLSRVIAEKVDSRGRCFKTGEVVKVGVFCNLCLSVFKKEAVFGSGGGEGSGVCFTCGAEIEEFE